MALLLPFHLSAVHCALLLGTLCTRISSSLHLRRGSWVADEERAAVAHVDIYYEALCPYCHTLLNESVRQVWRDSEMRGRVNISLYPFGNAMAISRSEVSAGYEFWHADDKFPLVMCQHGEMECLGNMIQSCAMDNLKTPEKYMPFILCLSSYSSHYSVESTSFTCGKKLGVNMTHLKACTASDRGHQLVMAAGNVSMSATLNREYVPWVVINGRHYPEAERGNLVTVLCSLLSPRPTTCTTVKTSALNAEAQAVKIGGESHSFKPCLKGQLATQV